MAWVYLRSEPNVYTVGHYSPDGTWHPDSDYATSDAAADRVRLLNGGTPVAAPTDATTAPPADDGGVRPTPGEWLITDALGVHAPGSSPAVLVTAPVNGKPDDRRTVAAVYGADWYANAKLIASAPSQDAALRAVRADAHFGDLSERTRRLVEQSVARAAVATPDTSTASRVTLHLRCDVCGATDTHYVTSATHLYDLSYGDRGEHPRARVGEPEDRHGVDCGECKAPPERMRVVAIDAE